jgi:hypothetical protein
LQSTTRKKELKMAKGFKGQGAYSADRGDASAFKPDTSFFKNPLRGGEGENAGAPKHPDYAGGRTDRRGPVDSDLKYSGGNDGAKGNNTGYGEK